MKLGVSLVTISCFPHVVQRDYRHLNAGSVLWYPADYFQTDIGIAFLEDEMLNLPLRLPRFQIVIQC